MQGSRKQHKEKVCDQYQWIWKQLAHNFQRYIFVYGDVLKRQSVNNESKQYTLP